MIEKKTIIDQIEVTRAGRVQIRFAILLLEDGAEIDCKWHRSAVEPGGDVDAQLDAVNVHLTQMGKSEVGKERLDELRAIVASAHTPERVQEFQAMSARLVADEAYSRSHAPNKMVMGHTSE